MKQRIPSLPLILLALLPVSPLTAGDSKKTPPTGFEEECNRCRSTGRIPCVTCDGTGSLRKSCPTCSGKGRRPCPQCAPPGAGPRTASTGKVPCGACGGKGALEGASDRPCFRCRGAREASCMVCFGKKTLKCATTRYLGTCPDCSYVGTVRCPDCRDGIPFPPLEPPPDARPAAGPGKKAQRYGEAEYREERSAARTRWEAIGRAHEGLAAIMARDPGGAIARLRGGLGRLYRQAAEQVDGRGEAAQLPVLIREAQRSLEPLGERWSRSLDQFERLEKYQRLARGIWGSEDRWSLDLVAGGDARVARDNIQLLNQWLGLAEAAILALKRENLAEIEERLGQATAAAAGLQNRMARLKAAPRRARPAREASELEPIAEAAPGRHLTPPFKMGPFKMGPFKMGPFKPGPFESSTETPPAGDGSPPAEASLHAAPPREPGPAADAPSAMEVRAGGISTAAARTLAALGFLAMALCAGVYFLLERRESGRGPEVPGTLVPPEGIKEG